MSAQVVELSYDECVRLLRVGGVGRIAFKSPSGQQLVPVSFSVHEQAIVCRTTPYTELGWHGPGSEAAFEADELDPQQHTGWSVTARGTLHVVTRQAEIAAIKLGRDPDPWAGGVRQLYLKLVWRELTGRWIRDQQLSSPPAPLTGGRQIPPPGSPGTRRGPGTGEPPRW